MSAFICNNAHLDALLTWLSARKGHVMIYVEGRPGLNPLNPDDRDTIGRILQAENYRAVNHRYGETDAPAEPYKFRPYPKVLTPIEALKALACYSYQCAEPPDYLTTDAAGIVRQLESMATHELPGWNQARWEITD
jgi:hypothetical protein